MTASIAGSIGEGDGFVPMGRGSYEPKGITDMAERVHIEAKERSMVRKAKVELEHERAVEERSLDGLHPIPTDITDSDSMATRLPAQARNHYGCIRCEWRGTWKCGYGFLAGRGNPLDSNSHVDGICPERMNYLLSFSRGYAKAPTFSQWQKDYLVGKAAYQEQKDFDGMQDLCDRLAELESNPITELDDEAIVKDYKARLAELRKLVRQKRSEWHGLWKDVVAVEDRQVERETPKKIEVTERRLFGISDINRIVKELDSGKVVDADYEVIKDD